MGGIKMKRFYQVLVLIVASIFLSSIGDAGPQVSPRSYPKAPSFTSVNITGLTGTYIPYKQTADVLADSPISTDGTDVTISGDATVSGGDLVLGTSSVAGTVGYHDAGVATFYDDGDDTSVAVGPVADGTTALGITGSLDVSGDIEVDGIAIVNTTEPAISISMTGITGTDNQAIEIVGGEALDADEHWTGFQVKPDDLDPGGADTRIRGVAINLSGVDVTNVPESMSGLRISMPIGLTGVARDVVEAIYIDDGDVVQNYSVPSTAASVFTAYNFNVESASLDASSAIHIIDVVTSGTPAGSVAALATHHNVDPIHQHIEAFTSPSQTEFAGRKTTGGTVWADGIDAVEMFVVNSDAIYVGAAAQFSAIDVTMSSSATKNVRPTFWYNTAADAWTQFYPDDGTSGFQKTGLIDWPLSSITATWTGDGDPGGAETTAGYWIKIVRTSGRDPGTPTASNIDVGLATEYYWDKDGAVSIASISTTGSITAEGTLHGLIENIADDNSLSAAQCRGSINWLTGAETTSLPAAGEGMNVLLYSTDATVKTIAPNGSDHIWLNGADLGAGITMQSPGAVGDYIVLVARSDNNWYTIGQSGVWIVTP